MSSGVPKNKIKTPTVVIQSEHCDDADAKRVKIVDTTGDPITPTNRFPVDAVVSVTPTNIDTPLIANINVALANTEQSYTFPDGTGKISLKVRGFNAILKYAWTLGASGTTFKTVGFGVEEIIDGVYLTGKTIYFQVSKPNQIVEIQSWS